MKQYNNVTIEQLILNTLRYFSFFDYPPNFEEIYTFLKKKTSEKRLASILEKMKKENSIIQGDSFLSSSPRRRGSSKFSNYIDSRFHGNDKIGIKYTTPQYSTFKKYKEKQRISKGKIKKIQTFLKVISWFPQIQLVGLSGTVAMMNAQEKDDIDLFIITARKRLWTARIIALFAAQILGMRRIAGEKDAVDKVCLNLFFDESNLTVPKNKQTEYVAHEVLQMKPLINKGNTYERFLVANSWIYEIFPNAREITNQSSNSKLKNLDLISNYLEFLLKKLQLTIIKQHQTSEIVTNTQLWFFPEDFEKKLKLS